MVHCACAPIFLSPANVSTHKDNSSPHDDKERLEGRVVLDGLDGHALHEGRVVVQLDRDRL